MTKVQARFPLQRPIDAPLMARISAAHSIYGIFHIQPAPGLEGVLVEYDATRLSPADLESALISAGLPIAPVLA